LSRSALPSTPIGISRARRHPAHVVRLTLGRSPIVLRTASVADAKALARLKIVLSAETEHMVLDVADRRALLRRTLEELTAVARSERGIFVLERNGSLLGYIDVHGVLGEEAAEFASFSLALRQRWRGLGLGSDLVSAGEAWARRSGFIFLVILVATRNERALALYRRLGYTICDDLRTAGDVRNGVGDHYTMGRMIAPWRSAPPTTSTLKFTELSYAAQ
jgi:ribosomal protein S18 acetylase RimI-like enzyme